MRFTNLFINNRFYLENIRSSKYNINSTSESGGMADATG